MIVSFEIYLKEKYTNFLNTFIVFLMKLPDKVKLFSKLVALRSDNTKNFDLYDSNCFN